MSAARSFRRRAARERRSVVYVLPTANLNASPALHAALARRRGATITGRCRCGARGRMRHDGLHFFHELGCSATDEAIAQLLHPAVSP